MSKTKVTAGDDSVVIGNVEGIVGSRSVVIGPTDAHGNVFLTGTMAIGHGAVAGENSVAIGTNANAGARPFTPGSMDVAHIQAGLIAAFGDTNQDFQRDVLNALRAMQDDVTEINGISYEFWAKARLHEYKTWLGKLVTRKYFKHSGDTTRVAWDGLNGPDGGLSGGSRAVWGSLAGRGASSAAGNLCRGALGGAVLGLRW